MRPQCRSPVLCKWCRSPNSPWHWEIKQPHRGPVAAARMRVGKAQKRAQEKAQALKRLKAEHADELASIVVVSLALARAAGAQASPTSRLSVTDVRALGVLRMAVLCSASLALERRYSLSRQVERKVMQALMFHQHRAPERLARCLHRLRSFGNEVLLAPCMEWGEATTTLKSVGNLIPKEPLRVFPQPGPFPALHLHCSVGPSSKAIAKTCSTAVVGCTSSCSLPVVSSGPQTCIGYCRRLRWSGLEQPRFLKQSCVPRCPC